MPPKTRTGAAVKKVRRKEKKNIAHGQAHIKSTFNNTIVPQAAPGIAQHQRAQPAFSLRSTPGRRPGPLPLTGLAGDVPRQTSANRKKDQPAWHV